MRTATRRSHDTAERTRNASQGDAPLDAGALQSAIFNSANFSSIATDAKGVIQIFNVGAERMLGYEAAEVLDKITPADISDPEEVIARAAALSLELGTSIAPGFEALVFKASRGIEDVYALTYVRKDGSRFPAMVSVTALRDRDDVIIGYLLIGTDNTARKAIEDERKKLELALRQKNAELEAASRMKSEFLANMSHELRTPLNAIIGFSEVLADGLIGDMTDKQRGFIGDIFSSGKHLLSLINDILDLSKVEAGKMLLDLESVQVASLFANSLSIVREKAASRRINLTLDAGVDLGSVRADGRKVKQIVYNLLSNAVKFTAERGEVTLRASRVSRDAVGRLSGSRRGRTFPLAESEFQEFLEISVTDTGMGIPDASMDSLFKPFSQIDSGLSRKFEGTGLGLAMVKLLADLHGGAVAVESAVGEGSRFSVWLPVRAPQETRPLTATPTFLARDAQPGAPVALVVEDDFKSAQLIRVQLEAEGFRVLHAASAEAAFGLAMQQPLSLITLDIMLPNMDGWEFLGRLKQMPTLKLIPVVIISIVADPGKGFALGAASVMQKPISRQDLYESLVQLGLLPLAAGGTLKVLVVDDDPGAVEMIALQIQGLASTILRAHGGREAIEMARREMPDLIVLDLMMPEVSGFDVVSVLNEQPATARIPVLVVTAMKISDADRDRLNGYVTTIMEKTAFDGERFSTEVRRAMSGRHVAV
jgi:signal transduction histidine kinase/DNA-binding response OmpR family regulator